MSGGVFVTDVPAFAAGGNGGARVLQAVEAHQPDLYDRIVGALLVLFFGFFFAGMAMQRFGFPNRMEDVVFVLLVPFAYRYLPQRKNVLYWLIVAYFAMSMFPYLAAYLAGDYWYGTYPVFIGAKELEYFYIAFLVCQNRAWWVLRFVDFMSIVLILYGVLLLKRGEVDYYGIGSLATYQSPSMAGALYLFSAIWLHIRSKLFASRVMRMAGLGIALVGAVCVVATVSRSSIGALIVYVIAYSVLSLNAFGLGGLLGAVTAAPKVIQALTVMFVAAGMTGLAEITGRLLSRFTSRGISSGIERTSKWQHYLDKLELPEWIIGKGKGFPNALDGTVGMGVDSQYVRTILEMGVFGVILLAAIVMRMLYTIVQRRGEWQHAFAVVAAMLVLSVPMEAFQVSKSGGFFWLIMFYLYFCQRRVVGTAAIATPVAPIVQA